MVDQTHKENEELRVLVEYYKNVLRCMTGGIIVIDSEKRITTFNRMAEVITGLKSEDVLGKSLSDISQIEELGEILLDTTRDGRDYRSHEMEIRNVDGKVIPVGVSTSVLKQADGKRIGAIEVFRDIAELKNLIAKLEESKAELEARYDELEKFTRVAVGREKKMIELKRRIKELERRIKKQERELP